MGNRIVLTTYGSLGDLHPLPSDREALLRSPYSPNARRRMPEGL